MNEHHKVVGRPFRPGVSGNPGGRPRELRDVTELARSHSPKAIETLVVIVNDETAPPAARIAASNAILDRGHGKPAQTLDASVRPGEFSVADRIIARWKENLAKLNAEQPLTIEGEKVDVTPGNRINPPNR